MAESIPPASEGPLLFGRYRVLRELGRGGMGVVQLAHDEELHLDVALKLVPDLVVQDAEAIDDLKKEVLRGRELAHPGIVRTHDFARDSDSAAIVMEYIEGSTLADLKAQQPDRCFDPADLLPWLEQLCPILDYAHHTAKIAHRDLKPRNIMLTAAGRVKVADFGIASSLADSQSRVSLHANTSGTPPYMSPQQLQGARPSHLDDLYALGALLYELLTGKPPFFRGNIPSQVIGTMPPPMTARREELGIVGRAAISPVWEETIAACLAKDPAGRPQSAGDILARLRRDPPTITSLNSIANTPSIRQRRARWPWAVGIVFIGLGVFVLVQIGGRVDPNLSQKPATEPIMPPSRPGPMPMPRPQLAPDSRLSEMLLQARTVRDRGDMSNALLRFREANNLDPRNPEVIAEIAVTYEKLGLPDKAAEHWKRVYDMGESAGVYFSAAQAKMRESVMATEGGAVASATFGIGAIECQDIQNLKSVRHLLLKVPIQLRIKEKLKVSDVTVEVLFVDSLNDKTVGLTTALISNRWSTAPVDWRDGEREVLEVEYNQPLRDPPETKQEDRKYYGYVVRLYYKSALQAVVALPKELSQKFPGNSPPVREPTASFPDYARHLREKALKELEPEVKVIPTTPNIAPGAK